MVYETGHIIFPKKTKYKDIAPLFESIYVKFLDQTNQLLEKHDKEKRNTIIKLNIMDLKKNRKPPGHNLEGGAKLIFPIRDKDENVRFYIESFSRTEVTNTIDCISYLLNDNDIDHSVKMGKLEYTEDFKRSLDQSEIRKKETLRKLLEDEKALQSEY